MVLSSSRVQHLPMSPIPNGYYAAKEVYHTLDWRFGSLLDQIPPAPRSFWQSQIQYNQLEVHPMSCTIFAAAGAVSDLTGYRFNKAQFQALVAAAKKDDFSDTEGWYIYKAVDLVREWWKREKQDDLVSYRLDIQSRDLIDVLAKGYSIVTGYRGNGQYNQDVETDGILDNLSIGNTTYGHAIRIVQDQKDTNYARVIIDNYLGYQPFNLYRIRVQDLPELVNTGVFYYSGYIFVMNANRPFKDVPNNSKTEWFYSCLEWAYQEGLIGGYEDGTFRPEKPVTRAEMVVLLKRLYDKLNSSNT